MTPYPSDRLPVKCRCSANLTTCFPARRQIDLGGRSRTCGIPPSPRTARHTPPGGCRPRRPQAASGGSRPARGTRRQGEDRGQAPGRLADRRGAAAGAVRRRGHDRGRHGRSPRAMGTGATERRRSSSARRDARPRSGQCASGSSNASRRIRRRSRRGVPARVDVGVVERRVGRRLGLARGGRGCTRLTWPATPQSGDFMRRKRRRATSNDEPSTPDRRGAEESQRPVKPFQSGWAWDEETPPASTRLRRSARAMRVIEPPAGFPSLVMATFDDPVGRPRGSISVDERDRGSSSFPLVDRAHTGLISTYCCRLMWGDQLGHAGPRDESSRRAGSFFLGLQSLLEFDATRYFSVGPPTIGKGLTAVSSKLST